MTRLFLLALGALGLFFIQSMVIVLLPQPFDHFPVFIAAGLLAMLSFRPVVGTVFFAIQGLGIDLISVIPGVTTMTAVILAYLCYLILKQIITHQSFYASFIVAFFTGALWFLLVYGFALYSHVDGATLILHETLWGSLALAFTVSITQLFGPRVLNRVDRVIRLTS